MLFATALIPPKRHKQTALLVLLLLGVVSAGSPATAQEPASSAPEAPEPALVGLFGPKAERAIWKRVKYYLSHSQYPLACKELDVLQRNGGRIRTHQKDLAAATLLKCAEVELDRSRLPRSRQWLAMSEGIGGQSDRSQLITGRLFYAEGCQAAREDAWPKSEAAFHQARERNDDFRLRAEGATCLAGVARTQGRTGDRGRAMSYLALALELDPHNPLALELHAAEQLSGQLVRATLVIAAGLVLALLFGVLFRRNRHKRWRRLAELSELELARLEGQDGLL